MPAAQPDRSVIKPLPGPASHSVSHAPKHSRAFESPAKLPSPASKLTGPAFRPGGCATGCAVSEAFPGPPFALSAPPLGCPQRCLIILKVSPCVSPDGSPEQSPSNIPLVRAMSGCPAPEGHCCLRRCDAQVGAGSPVPLIPRRQGAGGMRRRLPGGRDANPTRLQRAAVFAPYGDVKVRPRRSGVWVILSWELGNKGWKKGRLTERSI